MWRSKGKNWEQEVQDNWLRTFKERPLLGQNKGKHLSESDIKTRRQGLESITTIPSKIILRKSREEFLPLEPPWMESNVPPIKLLDS